jgi:hypothetical protein
VTETRAELAPQGVVELVAADAVAWGAFSSAVEGIDNSAEGAAELVDQSE